jgi:hypothetical protein
MTMTTTMMTAPATATEPTAARTAGRPKQPWPKPVVRTIPSRPPNPWAKRRKRKPKQEPRPPDAEPSDLA